MRVLQGNEAWFMSFLKTKPLPIAISLSGTLEK